MKNLSLTLIVLIILIQFIQIKLSYASAQETLPAEGTLPTQGTEPTQIISTVQISEPTPPTQGAEAAPVSSAPDATSAPISAEQAEQADHEKADHEEADKEAKEHMIILVSGIVGGCVGTAALIFTAWFIFKKLKGKREKEDNRDVVEEDVGEFDSFVMQIPGSNEYKESQTLSSKRSRDNFSLNSINKNIYTQAAIPPQPKNIDNVDSRVIQHIKQELLKDLHKQGDHANIPVAIPIYDTSSSSGQKDAIQQIKQETLRELDAPNQSRSRDSISIAASEENLPLGIDRDEVNRLKQEALAEIKNELKERLRKEVSLPNKYETHDLT